jgi:hypothetical protein
MNALLPLLAELEQNDQLLMLKTVGHSGWSQTAIIFGSIGVVAVSLFLIVYCFRKQILRRKRRHHHHQSAPKVAASTASPVPDEDSGRGRKKWRRSRHPLNPTLAETHGLPPIRDESAPPPPP